jgi:hypothetical protein
MTVLADFQVGALLADPDGPDELIFGYNIFTLTGLKL